MQKILFTSLAILYSSSIYAYANVSAYSIGSGYCHLDIGVRSSCDQNIFVSNTGTVTESGSLSDFLEHHQSSGAASYGNLSYFSKYSYGSIGAGFSFLTTATKMGGAISDAHASAGFEDYLTVGGEASDIGKLVLISVTKYQRWEYVANPIIGNYGVASYDFRYWDTLAIDDMAVLSSQFAEGYDRGTKSSNGNVSSGLYSSNTFALYLKVGQTIKIDGSVYGIFSSRLSQGFSNTDASTIDGIFGSEMKYSFSSSVPGITITSLSGHDYSVSSIPEPHAIQMLLAGIAIISVGRRKSLFAKKETSGTPRFLLVFNIANPWSDNYLLASVPLVAAS